jgi:hypothetical protein
VYIQIKKGNSTSGFLCVLKLIKLFSWPNICFPAFDSNILAPSNTAQSSKARARSAKKKAGARIEEIAGKLQERQIQERKRETLLHFRDVLSAGVASL